MDIDIAGPSWKQYEDKIRSSDNLEASTAAEAFQEERAKEMAVNPAARRWEEARRAEILKNKGIWKKEEIQKEKDRQQRIIDNLRNGGVMSGGLRPARGLLIVKQIKEGKTSGGLILPDQTEYESNMAIVIRVGDPQFSMGNTIPAPCAEGEKVLIRKGSGLNIKINDEPCLLIRFDEVLGVVDEHD